ncbi:MAG: WYL domain-containing protein [Xanthomonadales bacterium]|nr:WYL domain-containing protein [Xanthomonadales bacterium]
MSALTWQLVEEYLQPLLPISVREELEPQFQSARNFLKETGSDKLRRWKQRVRYLPRAMPLPPPKIAPEVLEAVYTALLEGRQLEVHYRSRGQSRARPLTLNPLALVVRETVYYLVTVVEPFEDTVHTALHRMSRPEVLDSEVREPEGFDLDAHIQAGRFQYASGCKMRLVARFDEYAAQALLEAPLSRDQESRSLEDGRIEIAATVMESNQLLWWLLGFGSNVEVVSPESLCCAIRKEVEYLADRYLTRA